MVLIARLARRLRSRPWLQAAACTWLPPLSALALSPLAECAHCLRLYAGWYILAPGAGAGLLAAPFGGTATTTAWIALPSTLGLFLATRAGLGARSDAVRACTASGAILCSAASSVALGHVLRM